jgi:hypothetical protein
MLTAGRLTPPKTNMRPGSLPDVKKTAVDAMINPTARIPAKSSIEVTARNVVRRNQVLRSEVFMNDRLDWIGFNMS